MKYELYYILILTVLLIYVNQKINNIVSYLILVIMSKKVYKMNIQS